MPRLHLTPGKDPVPIVQEAGWASGPVWTGVDNLASTGIRSPDRPARRQLLYRLRYPSHNTRSVGYKNQSVNIVYRSIIVCFEVRTKSINTYSVRTAGRNFRRVHKTVKSDHYLRHICLSVRISVRMQQYGSY